MNPQHLLIDNACRIEVLAEYNPFTDKQRKDLLELLDEFKNTKVSNIWKFAKKLKKFEDVFINLGGNHDKLEARIRQIRDTNATKAKELFPWIVLEKSGDAQKELIKLREMKNEGKI
ncbi:MAG: hypothetical protein O8C58_00835 [Candidatus Methanoperedens sp.]|nr:hypothetical protein [Candidatus Methanoperedens sp.]